MSALFLDGVNDTFGSILTAAPAIIGAVNAPKTAKAEANAEFQKSYAQQQAANAQAAQSSPGAMWAKLSTPAKIGVVVGLLSLVVLVAKLVFGRK